MKLVLIMLVLVSCSTVTPSLDQKLHDKQLKNDLITSLDCEKLYEMKAELLKEQI